MFSVFKEQIKEKKTVEIIFKEITTKKVRGLKISKNFIQYT